MTPRQRIVSTLHHERPDRTPTDGWFHPEVVGTLQRHFATDDFNVVRQKLGIEGWANLSPSILFGDYDEKAGPRPGPRDGRRAIWMDEQRYEDQWAVRWRLGVGDRYQQWLGGPLQLAATTDDVLHYAFPTEDDIREPQHYAQRVAELKRDHQFVCGGIENPFKRYWHLRGYENALMDYVSDPDIVSTVYDRLFNLSTHLAMRMARAGVDMIKVVGDVAMQDRILMGPDRWRAIDKPRWAALIEACRTINKDTVFFFHSDGKLTDLMDDLIDVGFTAIHPIQPECMNPVEVKQRWGDRVTLMGCISLQRTLPFGSVADVSNEVKTLVGQCGYNGGLVLMPSNVIQPDTPVENIIACYEAARDYVL